MIRAATEDDVPAIAQLEYNVSMEVGWDAYPQELLLKLCEYTDVLVVNDTIIGFCIYHTLTKSTMLVMRRLGFDFAQKHAKGRCVDTCHFTNIAVCKAHRKQGYGTRMVQHACNKCPHKYVRYTSLGGNKHCIQRALEAKEYVRVGVPAKESTYANGADALRHVFKRANIKPHVPPQEEEQPFWDLNHIDRRL